MYSLGGKEMHVTCVFTRIRTRTPLRKQEHEAAPHGPLIPVSQGPQVLSEGRRLEPLIISLWKPRVFLLLFPSQAAILLSSPL